MQVNEAFHPYRVAFRITFIYIVVGVLWILLSDKVMEWMISDKSRMTEAAMLKGWVYVIITGLIIYRLIAVPLYKLKEYQDLLHRNAYQDSLTGLPNRLALYEDVSKHMEQHPDQRTDLLFLDLDKFKFINDCLGHSFGDKLIQQFNCRLQAALAGGGKIYRLAGDEFVVWVFPLGDEAELERLAAEAMDCVREPFDLDGSHVHTTVSIGIAHYPADGNDVEQLLRCADIAMYRSKKAGGNTYTRYHPRMNDDFEKRMNIEKRLRTALKNQELELYYQPQYDLQEQRIVGFEALLRWNNPQLGFVPPDRFIPIAEDTHLIIPIGRWVLNTACSFISRLRERTGQPYTISVNISMLQIVQDGFVEMVEEALSHAGLPPEALELEITESIFMESLMLVDRKISYLREQGVRIALDDFGKGYSSLNHLMQLPISTIKIDKSFIDSIITSPQYMSLVRYIVQIGLTFGLEVIAEGVEDEDQVLLLATHSCRHIQGYWFSKPLPERELAALTDLSALRSGTM